MRCLLAGRCPAANCDTCGGEPVLFSVPVVVVVLRLARIGTEIHADLLLGFNLGLLFSGAMVLLASISILYSTSNIIHHYGTEQYVAAALGLFASVALLFWYVLRILMILRSGD